MEGGWNPRGHRWPPWGREGPSAMGTARVDIELRFADALLISADGVSTTQVLRRQGQRRQDGASPPPPPHRPGSGRVRPVGAWGWETGAQIAATYPAPPSHRVSLLGHSPAPAINSQPARSVSFCRCEGLLEELQASVDTGGPSGSRASVRSALLHAGFRPLHVSSPE